MAEQVVVTVLPQPVLNEAVTAALRDATPRRYDPKRCPALRSVTVEVQEAHDLASFLKEEMPFQKTIGMAG